MNARIWWRVGLLLAVAGLSFGCDDSSSDPLVEPGADLSEEMAEVELQSDAITHEIVAEELKSMGVVVAGAESSEGVAPVVEERTILRSRPCPAGGELTVEGSIVRTSDPATGVMEAEITGSRTRSRCAWGAAS